MLQRWRWGEGWIGQKCPWEREFDRWFAPFWTALGDGSPRRWGPVCVRGLLGPGDRKSCGRRNPYARESVRDPDVCYLSYMSCGQTPPGKR